LPVDGTLSQSREANAKGGWTRLMGGGRLPAALSPNGLIEFGEWFHRN
jgi:hypothetical protein